MGSVIDLHMHTTASDGTDYPEDLIKKIKEKGIRTFAVTDHDTIDGSMEMGWLIPNGVMFFRGIELSCVTSIGRVHILGYGFDPENSVFKAMLQKGKDLRRQKLDRRIAYMKEECGIPISDIEIDAFHRMKSCGKPHLANMLINKGYAKTKNEAIQKYIDPSGTEDMRISSSVAIAGIKEAGGIAVWAHPLGEGFYRDKNGRRFHNMQQCYAQLQELIRQGIMGLECWYSQYSEEQIKGLLQAAEAYHLYVSGGSDYHGKNKDIELGTLNAFGKSIGESDLNIMKVLRLKAL